MPFEAPEHPPPLLTPSQTSHLVSQGHLPLPLSAPLADLYAQITSIATTFFSLPEPLKRALYPSSNGTERGYYTVPGEKEYLTLRCHEHTSSSSQQDSETPAVRQDDKTAAKLEPLAAELWRRTTALLRRILYDIARHFDADPSDWDVLLEEHGTGRLPASWEEAGPTLLRLFRYEKDEGVADRHTDLGLLTLCVGTGRGLQVWERVEEGLDGAEVREKDEAQGRWVDAAGPTVLVGNVVKVLTGNRVVAGEHRVVGNPDGRRSVVFALRPSLQHPEVRQLWTRIVNSKFNVNEQRDVRERQIQNMRARRLEKGGVQNGTSHHPKDVEA